MKKIILIPFLFCLVLLAVLYRPDAPQDPLMPKPTDGTIVRLDAEDTPKRKAREAWFELMHQTEEGVDWREIEKKNNKIQVRYKHKLRQNLGSRDPLDGESVANGNLKGKWLERGSNNNAGNMRTVNYFPEEDMYFGRSDGGTLWKGDRSGFNWEVVNQDYRFTGDLVEARYNDEGTIRFIAALNHQPVYSDDGGMTWIEGVGIESSTSARMQDFVEGNNGDIFVLQKQFNIKNMSVYKSSDNGTTWENVITFDTPSHIDLKLVKIHNTDNLMVIEQLNTDLTRLHMYTPETNTFEVVRAESNIGFGGSDRANLNATFADDSLRLYVLNHENDFFVSTDTARTWRYKSHLPTEPWDVGVFVLPSDHTKMLYGEVNPYRSNNEGKFWNKVSDWWEYYGDIFGKMHADIMDIKEFRDIDGNPFTVVCNHGGISESLDGETFDNVALISLNIGQYYSVVTHPTEREWVFAGAQDQGFQRGKIYGDDEASLDQVFSGDYGHIVFSGEEDNMWTVYPWGSVSYFNNPLIQGPSASWTLDSDNESVWIPPLLGHPDKSQNAIFMAGGSHEGGPGSYMIRLDVGASGEITTSQFDYNFSTFGGEVSAMAISHIDNNYIYVATTSGNVFKSSDAGETFERKAFNLPGSNYLYGSCIKASLIDLDVVYLSGSGYSGKGVYKSTDAGETYQVMSNGLPKTMVFCLAPNEDESLIYAATEAGPYVYITELEEWFNLSGTGTPYQAYWSVEYLPETKTARFGTYGRGIWDFELEEGFVATKEELIANRSAFNVYPNPFTDHITLDIEYSGFTDINITNQEGKLVKTIANKNLNNLTIDLSELTTGIYFVSIRIENRLITEKIVKN